MFLGRTRMGIQQVHIYGKCGSCYAFAATGAVEGAWAIHKGNLTELSPSEIVDCSGPEGNKGCQGGITHMAYDYIIKNNGICAESVYPYVENQGGFPCKAKSLPKSGVTITGYTNVSPQGSESSLQTTPAKGPVSVAVFSDSWLYSYKSGIFNFNGTCESDPSMADHAMLLVGSGHDSKLGLDYWLVKNSFGTKWGESGYLRLGYGSNKCGVANFGQIVEVDGPATPTPAPVPTPAVPTPAPAPTPPVPTPAVPTPAVPTPSPLNCQVASGNKTECGGFLYTTEKACLAALGGNHCCWDKVGAEIWCYNYNPKRVEYP
jgi:hypothetical protein